MNRNYARFAMVALAGTFTAAASAQWVEFENQTSERLVVSDPSVGAGDGQERDYSWADLNQNGWVDIVVMRKTPFTTVGARRNVLFMNEFGMLVDRSAEYASAGNVPGDEGFLTPTNDRDSVITDVDGDGWLDVVTAATLSDGQPKHISHPRIYMNLGNDGGGDWQGLFFDNDRIPTLACCNGSVAHAPRFCAVDAGDITGNGSPDLYFGDYDGGLGGQAPPMTFDFNDRLLVNNGNGFFADETNRLPSSWLTGGNGAFTTRVIIEDWNQNGQMDIMRDNGLGTYNMELFYNNPNNQGTFLTKQFVMGSSPYFVQTGDINNNGRLDLMIARDGTDLPVYNMGTNQTTGQVIWQNGAALSNSIGFQSNIFLADLDQDGWLDAFIANMDIDENNCFSSQPARMYRNNGNPPTNTFSVDYGNINSNDLQRVFDWAVVDINGDGWLDFMSAHGCSVPATKVWIQQPPLSIAYEYPQGLPSVASPEETTEIVAQINAEGADIESVDLMLSIDGGPFVAHPMSDTGGSLYSVDIPAIECGLTAEYYIITELVGGFSVSDPPNAPGGGTYNLTSVLDTVVVLAEDFDAAVIDWAVDNDPSLNSGEWEQVTPEAVDFNGDLASPDADFSGSGMAFITQQCADGQPPIECSVSAGPTYLTSPTIDVDGEDAIISYARWFYCNHEGVSNREDFLTTEISNDGGQNWVFVHETSGTNQQWETVEFLVSDYVTPTNEVVVRFSVEDAEDSSVTNAGIDKFDVEVTTCETSSPCPADLNGDSTVNVSDLLLMLGEFGACPGGCDADLNGDETVNVSDLLLMLGEFGACPE